MDRIKAKLPPAVQQLVSIQQCASPTAAQADKEIKDMVVTINIRTGEWIMK